MQIYLSKSIQKGLNEIYSSWIVSSSTNVPKVGTLAMI